VSLAQITTEQKHGMLQRGALLQPTRALAPCFEAKLARCFNARVRRHRRACAAGKPTAPRRPGGACGADARRAHAQTPTADRGTAAHGGDATLTRGRARL
jgi:hypothetical protein